MTALAMFLDLVRIDSPSKSERQVADYIIAWAGRLGFPVEEDDAGTKIGGTAGNLTIRVPGHGDPVFLSTHMDVVEPCRGISPQVVDGVVTSDGTTVLGADSKASLAAILETVDTQSRRPSPPALELVFTICEEMGLVGARHYDVSRLRAREGFVVDSAYPVGTVISGAPTEYKFDAIIHGTPSHAGIEPEKGVSAALIAAKSINAIPWGRLDKESTSNVGMIHGGMGTNVVMPLLEIKGETRSFQESKVLAQVERIKHAFLHEAETAGGSCDFSACRSYTGYQFDATHPLAQRVKRAAAQIGAPFDFLPSGGASDANIFNEKGKPTVVLGYGPKHIHTCQESMAVKDLEKLVDLLRSLVTVT